MTTGAAIGIGVAVVGAGGIAYVVLRKRDPATGTGATGAGAAGAGTVGGASASQPPGGGPLDTINAINAKACQAIAGAKVGSAAKTGCAAYSKYLSPIALGVTLPLKVIEAVPVVGGAVKPVERAVSTATIGALKAAAAAPAAAGRVLSIADLPFKASNPAVNTVAKIAAAPIELGIKSTQLAAHAASSAVSAIRHLF